MRWFKHMSNARNNEKLVKIRIKWGMWGIGVYWDLVAQVAERFDGSDPVPVAHFGLWELCRRYGVKRKKLVLFFVYLENIRVLFAETNEDVIEIKIPSLLKHQDTYTKKFAQCSKQEVEVEVDLKSNITKPAPAAPADHILSTSKKRKTDPKKPGRPQSQVDLLVRHGVDEQVARDFVQLRKGKRAAITETAIRGIAREAQKAGISLQSAIEKMCADGWQGFNASWVKDATTARAARNVPTKEDIAREREEWERRARDSLPRLESAARAAAINRKLKKGG